MSEPTWEPQNKAESVARAALMEVGRLDLATYLFGVEDLVHFDDNAEGAHILIGASTVLPPPSIADLALIERAMAIGFHACEKPYSCEYCEYSFRRFGIDHKSNLATAA